MPEPTSRTAVGRVRALVASLAVVALAGAACSGDEPAGPEWREPSPATVAPSEELASPQDVVTEQFEQLSTLEQLDVAIALAYIERRFGDQTDLTWAAPLIDSAVQSVESSDDADELASYLRFIDGEVAAPDLPDVGLIDDETGTVNTDAMIAAALWCDEVDLPAGFEESLTAAAELGDYELTHAIGSTRLLVENECISAGRGAELLEEFSEPSAALLAEGSPADLELETCALLAWAGRPDLIPEDFSGRVAEAQLVDGGWPLERGETVSHWHATVWGLRCALELEFGPRLEPTRWVARSD